ncbi:MAG: hypothetical protein PS018_14100, partial [bacterium]|nr:hypothetical protein [bacterium]
TGMRLVNVFLLLVVIAILTAWLSRLGKVAAWSVGMTALAVPMVWVLAGLALSEMPAMALVTLSLCLQLKGLQSLGNDRPVLGWFLASAVALGISVWGRQPYILLAGVPCLLALLERRLRIAAALFVLVVVAIALPQFVIWKGLVPPSHAEIQQGLAPKHALLSLGYAGVTMFLLAPLPGWRLTTWMVTLFVLIAIVNVISDALVFYPLYKLTERYVPPFVLPALGNLCGSVIAAIGTIFVLQVLEVLWTDRRNLEQVAIHSGLLCMSLAPMFISHDFSSRYTAMSLPYMLLAAHCSRQWGAPNVITVLVGAVLGFLSLFSYLYL